MMTSRWSMAKNQISLAYNNLQALMLWSHDAPFEIQVPAVDRLPEIPTENVEQIYSSAMDHMPQVKQAEISMVQADYGVKVASSAYYPTLSLYGNLSTVYSESGVEALQDGFETRVIGYLPSTGEDVLTLWPVTNYTQKSFSSQLTDNFGQSVGLQMSIPIYNGNRTSAQVQNARLNAHISQLNLSNTQTQLRTDVTTALTNLQAANSQYQAALTNEEAQRKNFEFSQKRADAGMMNSVDLLNAKNMYFQSQVQVLNAKYELLFRTMIINFYKGDEIKF